MSYNLGKRFNALRPVARQFFKAPASSAASELVFSKAGLIMRPDVCDSATLMYPSWFS